MRVKRCVECGAKHHAKGLCSYHYHHYYQQRPKVKARLKAYHKEYQKRYAVQKKKRVKAGDYEKRGLIQSLMNRFRVFEQKIKNA